MRTAQAVIGANWGDEGKGLLTDYLADADTLVVRYNGGAQAGHTVCTPEGRRHVFHHVGAGALRGADTLLSRFFVCSPMIFNEERAALSALDASPTIYVDGAAPVTTPYDMMLNQIVEESRGADRHGSCGLGVNETMLRSGITRFFLAAQHLPSRQFLNRLKNEWVPRRLDELGVVPSVEWRRRLDSEAVLERFYEEWSMFRDAVRLCRGVDVAAPWRGDVLFEGAQGLLLDRDHRWFPHVTHSNTGLVNVDRLAREWGIDHLDVTYVTRAYATRHGAGPLPHEDPRLRYDDATNAPNLWQGDLRLGALDLDLLQESIAHDLARATVKVDHRIAVTHLDQVDKTTDYVTDKLRCALDPERLVNVVAHRTGSYGALPFYGPTRKDRRT